MTTHKEGIRDRVVRDESDYVYELCGCPLVEDEAKRTDEHFVFISRCPVHNTAVPREVIEHMQDENIYDDDEPGGWN